MLHALHDLRAKKQKKKKTVVVLRHTLRRSSFKLTSLWVVFSLSTLYFKLNFLCESSRSSDDFLSLDAMSIDKCSNTEKLSKNAYHFAWLEDKPSFSSLVLHSSQLSHSRRVFTLSLLHETSLQRARKNYPRENRYVPKITLEGLRLVESLYWGFILWALSSLERI